MTQIQVQIEKELSELADSLGSLLIERKISLSVAESCTGGWLAKVLTDLPGSSRWFDRGFVTYSNMAKQEMLGVNAKTLEQYGAVSEETVREMADGVIVNSLAGVSVSISGLAGPGGGTSDRPVGTVWMAWAIKNSQNPMKTAKYFLMGGRNDIRANSVKIALEGLLKIVQNLP